MRAFVNFLAIAVMLALAYGVGWLNKQQRWSEEATLENTKARNMAWIDKDWYRGSDGEEWRSENGRITRANGCKNELGVITKKWMKKVPDAPANPETKETE